MRIVPSSRKQTLSTARRCVLASVLGAVLCSAAALPSSADAATREQAIAQALAADGNRGRVLGVQLERGGDGRSVYAVKVITDGRVRVHRYPADS